MRIHYDSVLILFAFSYILFQCGTFSEENIEIRLLEYDLYIAVINTYLVQIDNILPAARRRQKLK